MNLVHKAQDKNADWMPSTYGFDERPTGVERLDLRIVLVACSTIFYAVTFLPLQDDLGPGVVSLSVVPVALAGWLFGLRAGLSFGVIAYMMNTVLLVSAGPAELSVALWGGAVAGSAALLVGAVAGTLRDVSQQLRNELAERRWTEAALRESEERWRCLVESAPAVFLTVDREGTVLYSNQPIAGRNVEDVAGSSVYSFVPQAHQAMFQKALERLFRTGQPQGYEVADTDDYASPSLHVIRFGPVERDGRVVAATIMNVDITEELE